MSDDRADGWVEVKCIMAPDGHRRVVILLGSHGMFKFEIQTWQKYYERSAADLGPVEDGLWGGDSSGFYETAASAEMAARREADWLRP